MVSYDRTIVFYNLKIVSYDRTITSCSLVNGFFFTGLLRGGRVGGAGVSGGHPQPDYWGLSPVHLGRHRLQILQDARQHRVLQSQRSA